MSGRLRFLRTKTGMVGLALLAIVLGIALFGPFFAPYSPTKTGCDARSRILRARRSSGPTSSAATFCPVSSGVGAACSGSRCSRRGSPIWVVR